MANARVKRDNKNSPINTISYIHGVNDDNNKRLVQKADARRDHAIPLFLYPHHDDVAQWLYP
jgi:hypothetical protein